MNNLYLDILNYLSPYGIGHKTDISHLFEKYFLNPVSSGDLLLQGSRLNYITSFLNKMKNDGYIEYYNLTQIPTGQFVEWMFPLKIEAYITSAGYKFNDDLILSRKTKGNLKTQIIMAFVAVLTLGIGAFNVWFTTSKKDELEARIQRLQDSVVQLRLKQNLVKNPVKPPAEKSRR